MTGEDPDKDDGDPASCPMRRPVVAICSDDACDDEMTGSHSNGTGDQNGLSSKAIDVQDGGDGEEELQDTDHACCEKRCRVSVEAESLENLWSVSFVSIGFVLSWLEIAHA